MLRFITLLSLFLYGCSTIAPRIMVKSCKLIGSNLFQCEEISPHMLKGVE